MSHCPTILSPSSYTYNLRCKYCGIGEAHQFYSDSNCVICHNYGKYVSLTVSDRRKQEYGGWKRAKESLSGSDEIVTNTEFISLNEVFSYAGSYLPLTKVKFLCARFSNSLSKYTRKPEPSRKVSILRYTDSNSCTTNSFFTIRWNSIPESAPSFNYVSPFLSCLAMMSGEPISKECPDGY